MKIPQHSQSLWLDLSQALPKYNIVMCSGVMRDEMMGSTSNDWIY
jgi:hypothetical protein